MSKKILSITKKFLRPKHVKTGQRGKESKSALNGISGTYGSRGGGSETGPNPPLERIAVSSGRRKKGTYWNELGQINGEKNKL